MTPDVCPNCKKPYTDAASADSVELYNGKGAQEKTCVEPRDGDEGPMLLVIFHMEDDLRDDGDGDAADPAANGQEESTEDTEPDDGQEEATTSSGGRVTPEDLDPVAELVFTIVRDRSRAEPTRMIEVKGEAAQHDLSPDDVDRVVNDLKEGGYIRETTPNMVEAVVEDPAHA